MDDKNIKNNLKTKRMLAGLSQETMAEKLEMARITYVHLESGNTQMVNRHLLEAAEILNCKPEELVLGYSPSELATAGMEDLQAELERLKEQVEKLAMEKETLSEKCRMLTEQNNLLVEINGMLKKNLERS